MKGSVDSIVLKKVRHHRSLGFSGIDSDYIELVIRESDASESATNSSEAIKSDAYTFHDFSMTRLSEVVEV